MPGVEVRARTQAELDLAMSVMDDAISEGLLEFAPRSLTAGRIAGQISYKLVEVVLPPRRINFAVEVIIWTQMVGPGYLQQAADAVRGKISNLTNFKLPDKVKVRVRPLQEGASLGSGYSRG